MLHWIGPCALRSCQAISQKIDVDVDPALDFDILRGVFPEEDQREVDQHKQKTRSKAETAKVAATAWQHELGPKAEAVVASKPGETSSSSGHGARPSGSMLPGVGGSLLPSASHGLQRIDNPSGSLLPGAASGSMCSESLAVSAAQEASGRKRWYPLDLADKMKLVESQARACLPEGSKFVVDTHNGRFKVVGIGQRYKSFSWTVRSVPAAFALVYETAWGHNALQGRPAAPEDAGEVSRRLYGSLGL